MESSLQGITSSYTQEQKTDLHDRLKEVLSENLTVDDLYSKSDKTKVHVPWAGRAFKALDRDNRGYLLKHEILEQIKKAGVISHLQLAAIVNALESKSAKDQISFAEFESLISNNFIKRVLENTLIIPQFQDFWSSFTRCYNEIKGDKKYDVGQNADYIPSLAKANPKSFGSSFCSSDGQYNQIGETSFKFSAQSVSKVMTYAYLHDLY